MCTLIKHVRTADNLLPKLCYSLCHSRYGHHLFLQGFTASGGSALAVKGLGVGNGSEIQPAGWLAELVQLSQADG